MKSVQRRKLAAIVVYAYSRSRFWRDWFDNAKVVPTEIQNPGDLQRLPLCAKKDLLSRPVEERLTREPEGCVRFSTSGTTGPPMPVYLERSVARNYKLRVPTRLRYQYWARDTESVFFKDLQIAFARTSSLDSGMREDSTRTSRKEEREEDPHRVRNQILGGTRSRLVGPIVSRFHNRLCSTANMSEDISEVLPAVLEYRPGVIEGAISYLRLLADYATEKRLSDHIRPARFITAGEPVDEPNRAYIESVFRTNVYQAYGCNETGLVSFECVEKKGMHVIEDTVILEVLDKEGNPVPPGETGEIVATGLVNKAMPLIRYRLGDMGYMSSDGPCSCGITLPMLRSVEGRAAHYMHFPNGQQISPKRMLTLMHSIAGLPRCQAVQDAPESVAVRVFAQGKPFPRSSVDEFVSVLQKEAGGSVKISSSIMPAQRLAVKFSASVPFSGQ